MRSVFNGRNRQLSSDLTDSITRITLHLEGDLLGKVRGYTARHSSEAGWESRVDERGIWRCRGPVARSIWEFVSVEAIGLPRLRGRPSERSSLATQIRQEN
jgi:hypothetical protein